MTTVVNALLVRYRNGHVYVDRSDGHGRREQYVQMDGVRDRDHAIELGTQILRLAAHSRFTDARSGDVREIDHLPGVGYQLGDTMDGSLLSGLVVRLVGDGAAEITHQLADSTKTRQDAMARRLARAASGISGEYAAPVISRQAEGSGIDTTPPPFSQDQVEPTISKPWRVPRPFHCSWLEVELDSPLTTTHRVALLVNNVGVMTVTINAGDMRAVGIVDRSWHTGTTVRIAVPLPGHGTAGQTVTMRGAMI